MNPSLYFLFAQLDVQPQPQLEIDPVVYVVLAVFLGIALILGLVTLVGMWKVFTKAGEPGWAVLIPIYNFYVLLRIVGRPGWWLLLALVPIVNFIVFYIIVPYELVKSFGKGAGFFLGVFFLPFIFIPILGFGDARYQPLKRDIATAY